MAPTIISSSSIENQAQDIRGKETVRLILQALSEMGYSESVALLEKESGTLASDIFYSLYFRTEFGIY